MADGSDHANVAGCLRRDRGERLLQDRLRRFCRFWRSQPERDHTQIRQMRTGAKDGYAGIAGSVASRHARCGSPGERDPLLLDQSKLLLSPSWRTSMKRSSQVFTHQSVERFWFPFLGPKPAKRAKPTPRRRSLLLASDAPGRRLPATAGPPTRRAAGRTPLPHQGSGNAPLSLRGVDELSPQSARLNFPGLVADSRRLPTRSTRKFSGSLRLMIGSANLSGGGLEWNWEASVVLDPSLG